MTNISLPVGVTWDSPPGDLYRAIYPQCTPLADLIGNAEDAQAECERLEEQLGDVEGERDTAIRLCRDAETAVQSFAARIDALIPATGKLRDAIDVILSEMETFGIDTGETK